MFTLNTMTDEDLGLVSDSITWFATPTDNSSNRDILEAEILNVSVDPILYDPCAPLLEDPIALDFSWLDDLHTYVEPSPLSAVSPNPSPSPDSPSPPPPPDPEPFSTPDAQWQAILDRTPTTSFFYGVISTKIYCRSTCPSRRPHRSNVVFFSTTADATKSGFRACKRCKPDDKAGEAAEQRQVAAVERAKQVIEERAKKGEKVGLEKLASEAGLSTFYFHRVFKRRVGVTPEEWGRMCRRRSAG